METMEAIEEIYSKDDKYRIRILESWEKDESDSPEGDYYFDAVRLFVTRNRYFFPKTAEALDGCDEEDFLDLRREFGRSNVYHLSAHIHGAVLLKLGQVRADWDSGQIGILCIDREIAKKNGIKFSKKYTKEKYLEEYVESWNRYMHEPNYRFVVEKIEESDEWEESDEDWEFVDSCGGYGDMKHCIADAVASLKGKAEFEN